MSDSVITTAQATGEDIFELVNKIEPTLYGVERGTALIACLSIAITIMNPDIEPDKLRDAVSGASKWICLFLADEDYKAGTPGEMLN